MCTITAALRVSSEAHVHAHVHARMHTYTYTHAHTQDDYDSGYSKKVGPAFCQFFVLFLQ